MNVRRYIAFVSLPVCLLVIAAVSSAQTPSRPPTPAPDSQKPATTAEVKVTVKYSGKAMVDKSHRIWVWLFDSPNIGPDTMPLAEDSIDKNGGTVTFTGIAAKEVYVAVALDEKGGFMGQAAPPAGSPTAIYGAMKLGDKPKPIVPGPKEGSVVINLTDAQRMQ